MTNFLLIFFGKLVTLISKLSNLGNGSTWPGHIALSINSDFIKQIVGKNKFKTILIAGTNGKTTTAKLIRTILGNNGKTVFQNEGGANLLNGIASSLISNSSLTGKNSKDFAIFEIDENTLPLILKELTPDYLILLNLFRDQLDRYGEVNTISKKWQESIDRLSKQTTLILNADDPLIASLSKNSKAKALFFGLNDEKSAQKVQHSKDTIYCPNCNSKLTYSFYYFSHIGIWGCSVCGLKRPNPDISSFEFYPLVGVYNKYNTHASVLLAKEIGISQEKIIKALKWFSPAFGRGESIKIDDKEVKLFLSKNPTSFNESLRTIESLGAKNVLFVLNDRIPDGRDVSWIWDIEVENFIKSFNFVFVSGDRAYDMTLRLKYAIETQNSNVKSQNYNSKVKIFGNLKNAIEEGINLIKENETLYILPTYSAMLEVRKILTGKKIL